MSVRARVGVEEPVRRGEAAGVPEVQERQLGSARRRSLRGGRRHAPGDGTASTLVGNRGGATLTITFSEELTETPAPVAGCQVTAGTVHQAPVSAVGFQKNKAKENPP